MQVRQEDNIADNGFMRHKAVKGLLSRCSKLLQESSQYNAFHFRIPICIGYSSDLEPVEFEAFVDQVQTIVDQMNREIEAKKPASSHALVFDEIQPQETDPTLHEYTFYLYQNKYDSEKVKLWLEKNDALIRALYKSGHLVELNEVRSSPEWQYALEQYEEFILTTNTNKEMPKTSSDGKAENKTKASLLPSASLEEDAKRYLDSLKKQGKGQDVKLHDLVKITKDKVVDVLSWGIRKGTLVQKASIVLHYATPSKAMLNVFPYQEHLGYVPHSSVYQEFKKNNNITLGVQAMPLVTPLKDGERFSKAGTYSAESRPVQIPSGSISDNSSSTNSTDTSDDEIFRPTRSATADLDKDCLMDIFVGLKKRGLDLETAAQGAVILEKEVRKDVRPAQKRANLSTEERGRSLVRPVNQSSAVAAPSSVPSSPSVSLLDDESRTVVQLGARAKSQSPTHTMGTMFAKSNETSSQAKPDAPVLRF